MSAWQELLEAAREFHAAHPHREHDCRLGRALEAFPETPSLFDPPAEPEFDPDALTEDRIGGFRKTDPDTSRKGAVFVFPRSGSQRCEAFLAIAQAGERGATVSDVLRATRGRHEVMSTRMSELKRGGFARVIGERMGDHGTMQDVLVATSEGIAEARKRGVLA